MTPDLDVPIWPLLLVACGLWLLLAVTRRRRRPLRLVVVLAERRQDRSANDRPQDEQRYDHDQQPESDGEDEQQDGSIRVGHAVRILGAWELRGVPEGVAAHEVARAFAEATRG